MRQVWYSEIAGTPILVQHISNLLVCSIVVGNTPDLDRRNTCHYVKICLGSWDEPRKSFLVWWGMICVTGRSQWREYKQGLCTLYMGWFSDNHQYHVGCPKILFFFFRFLQNISNCLSILVHYYYIFLEIYSQTWKIFWNG